jgi:hypothetical protein
MEKKDIKFTSFNSHEQPIILLSPISPENLTCQKFQKIACLLPPSEYKLYIPPGEQTHG